jgi:hypothetical protein
LLRRKRTILQRSNNSGRLCQIWRKYLGSTMTYWPAGGGAFPFFPGFSLAALPHFMQLPLAQSCYRRTPKPAGLPTDFSDYLVYVTREALVATTTSLGKASSETHDALLKVNQLLACDRMMRAMVPAGVPGMAAWPGLAPVLPGFNAAVGGQTQTASTQAASKPVPAAKTASPSSADLAGLAGMASGATALNAAMSLAAAFLKLSPLIEPGRSAA